MAVKPYDKTTHGGKVVDVLTAQALLAVERILGYELTIVQGSYHKGVGASAGTHDGGGVVDLAPADWEKKVRALRKVGFAAWYRPARPGVWGAHIHAVLIGNRQLSPSAQGQVIDYRNKRNGLADNGLDDFPYHPEVIFKMPEESTVVVADWNLGPGEVEALARRVGGRLVNGHRIDHALAVGVDVVEVRNLGSQGSNHDALLYRLRLPNGEEFRIIGWNVFNGRSPARIAATVAKLIDRHQPHAVALSEAYSLRRPLKAIPGYALHQSRLPFGENRDCALLLRLDLRVLHSGIRRMALNWVGPKSGKRQQPRRYPFARVRTKGGHEVRLMSAHLPFGKAPVRESLDAIAAWIKN